MTTPQEMLELADRLDTCDDSEVRQILFDNWDLIQFALRQAAAPQGREAIAKRFDNLIDELLAASSDYETGMAGRGYKELCIAHRKLHLEILALCPERSKGRGA